MPRLAAPLLDGCVLWSFVGEIFGSSVAHAGWLVRTSVLDHLVAAGVGLVAFVRRDLLLG